MQDICRRAALINESIIMVLFVNVIYKCKEQVFIPALNNTVC
jgi:hypothetical protein